MSEKYWLTRRIQLTGRGCGGTRKIISLFEFPLPAADAQALAMGNMKNHLETQLLTILSEHPWFMAAIDAASDLGLSQWCIGAGVIRNIVFDYLDGGSTTPIRDVDVAYFDISDLSEHKDREYEGILKVRMPNVPWEVTNQAAVHLWFHKKFGYRVPPVNSIEEAVATWPETCTAVAVTKLHKDEYKIYTPCGLEDLFGMKIRRNPVRVDVRTYNARISSKQYDQCWKSVRIIK